MSTTLRSMLLVILGLAVAACMGAGSPSSAADPAPAASPTATLPAERPPASAPAAGTAATPSAPAASPRVTAGAVRYTIVPEASEARYRVREQLADRPLPSDAVGVTRAISGTIVVTPSGALVPERSRITVDLRTLQSDSSRRDNFIRRNTLETDRFPLAEFVPREIRGLPSPPPSSGDVSFEIVGDLTVHGVTRPTTWQVQARVGDGDVTGTATTSFTFADFEMSRPRVAVVLSVEDTIRLELDFRLTRSAAPSG